MRCGKSRETSFPQAFTDCKNNKKNFNNVFFLGNILIININFPLRFIIKKAPTINCRGNHKKATPLLLTISAWISVVR